MDVKFDIPGPECNKNTQDINYFVMNSGEFLSKSYHGIEGITIMSLSPLVCLLIEDDRGKMRYWSYFLLSRSKRGLMKPVSSILAPVRSKYNVVCRRESLQKKGISRNFDIHKYINSIEKADNLQMIS